MIFTKKIYMLIAIAGVLIAGLAAGQLWSNHKIGEMERTAAAAKEHADSTERQAAIQEQRAGEYKAKIEYLEDKLAEVSETARRQDEEIQTFEVNTNTARSDVDRARRVRSVAATADELCKKLEELGHPCG